MILSARNVNEHNVNGYANATRNRDTMAVVFAVDDFVFANAGVAACVVDTTGTWSDLTLPDPPGDPFTISAGED